jgi:hypothetical protein
MPFDSGGQMFTGTASINVHRPININEVFDFVADAQPATLGRQRGK